MALTITSPGVQIAENELQQQPVLPSGTNILAAGFAPSGPTDEVITVSTLAEYTQIFGSPTTPAERYLYHTVEPLLKTQANVSVYRLPYGSGNGVGFGSSFGALVYPVTAVDISQDRNAYGTALTTLNQYTSGVLYLIGQPDHFELNQTQYNNLVQQNGFSWKNSPLGTFNSFSDLGNAGIIVLNIGQTTVNPRYEGYYVGLADNTNATPATNFDEILNVQSVSYSATSTYNYTVLPASRLNFILSAASDATPSSYGQINASISEVMENLSQFDLNTRTNDDMISFGLFKLKQSTFSPTTIKLDYTLAEKYVGSLDYYRQVNSQQGGQPINLFLGAVEDNSPNVQVLINDYISHKNGATWLDVAGNPSNKVRIITSKCANVPLLSSTLVTLSGAYGSTSYQQTQSLIKTLTSSWAYLNAADSLFTVGAFADTNPQNKYLGAIPLKLDRMFSIAENADLYNLDITVDGGLSTIYAVKNYLSGQTGTEYFDDNVFVSAISGLAAADITVWPADAAAFAADWNSVFQRFAQFAEFVRKDHLFIADLPREIFVQGQNFKTLDNVANNFSQNVYNAIRNVLATVNTSYATTYDNWVQAYDGVLDGQVYVPFSGFAAAAMALTDSNSQPWQAPAGFNRGVVKGVTGAALYPKQKQRDQLYKISTNPVAYFANEGLVIYGQKTLLKRPSVFDRINVRRLFLALEKATAAAAKYYVFEPNTLLTRTNLVNTLTPIFEYAKNTEGLYDYMIVCDTRNNTPDIIDANELVVDIYLKPVRTAEFILVNFNATRTGVNFNELVG
jgi:hypothetical protein